MNRFVRTIFPILVVVISLVVDRHLGTLPPFFALVLFLPLEALRWIGTALALPDDYLILLVLLLGVPLLLLYWFAAYFLLAGVRPSAKEAEASDETSQEG